MNMLCINSKTFKISVVVTLAHMSKCTFEKNSLVLGLKMKNGPIDWLDKLVEK
jgi:hypothetical protein